MEIQGQLITVWAVAVVAWNPVARAAEPPRPTPTPRPGTLAALAQSTSLTHETSTPVVITNDNLTELAVGAVVTVMSSTAAEPSPAVPSKSTSSGRREQWRRRVLAQHRRIAGLEEKRSAVEAEIDRLERGRLDARTLDRIAKAEAKNATIEDEIRREERVLSQLVREARKEGAQPGWFR
jgi:septal ring factor EnvC (AmiA/AmiB activator)